ncbi:hypothetical protein V8C37DRAFT_368297 [Trichoderma ceciliae]
MYYYVRRPGDHLLIMGLLNCHWVSALQGQPADNPVSYTHLVGYTSCMILLLVLRSTYYYLIDAAQDARSVALMPAVPADLLGALWRWLWSVYH